MTDLQVKRILVPIDLSASSEAVLKYAYGMAHKFSADVEVLHVWEDPRYDGLEVVVQASHFTEDLVSAIQDSAKAGMTALLEAHPAPDGVSVTPSVIRGAAAPEIASYCEAHEVDLVIMGTHGRRGLSHFLLGSVAERTAQLAPCPVLVVPTKK